ncbi:MAG: hypothetical protein JW910_09405 [Anaerolineae bacterium]|nr:hypothetical protein [Anaerolineae bacterium]
MAPDRMITPGQRYALNKLLSEFAAGPDVHLFVISRLVEREITNTSELLLSEWQTIRNEAFPRWTANDWTISDAFRARVADLIEEYRELILGQLRLF